MKDVDTTGVERFAQYINAYARTIEYDYADTKRMLVLDFQQRFLGALLNENMTTDGLLFLLDPEGYIVEQEQRAEEGRLRVEELRLKVEQKAG